VENALRTVGLTLLDLAKTIFLNLKSLKP
jgi:hypothetical protein